VSNSVKIKLSFVPVLVPDTLCLDGGAWDRPTSKAKVATSEEALNLSRLLIN